MNIDDIDFTPLKWYGPSTVAIISEDEAIFIGYLPGSVRSRWMWSYLHKIKTFHEHFGNHMPVPIRKELLRGMAK